MNRLLLILRLCVFALIIFIAARPVVVRPESGASRWAVLLDTSKSMRVKDPVERFDAAKKIVASFMDAYSGSRLFRFADAPAAMEEKNLNQIQPDGDKTNLAEAVKIALAEPGVKGAVIVTDGRHVGGGDPVSEAVAAGKPIVLVGLGDKNLFRDIAVRSIQSPPFAFKNIPVSLSATVSAIGFAGKKITVRLKQGETVLSLQTVEVASNDSDTGVSFSWTPSSIGSKTLTVEATEHEGEVTKLNNRKDVTFDVGRDRFRVLYICGRPGPEYGMLRYQFKSDPAVELVTFVILRNAMNTATIPDSELSLIPFPTQDILIQQMPTFDLVVFEEFAYRQFGLMPTIMQAIKKKVEDGGAFLLMGETDAFAQGNDYDLPGIREMIPVEFYPRGAAVIEESQRLRVKTPQHPIFRIDPDPARNKALWESVVELDGFAPVTAVKPGAVVLADIEKGGRTYPVFTVWRHGRGRVAALSTRTTWRWAMRNEAASPVYQQLWKNMVLWLTHSDEYNTVRIALEGRTARLGEEATLRVWVFDEYFKPLPDAEIKVLLKNPKGVEAPVSMRAESDGVFSGSFQAEMLGQHEAAVWVTRAGKRYGTDRSTFRVLESNFEEEDLRPDVTLLKELAQSTGGRFIPAADFSVAFFKQYEEELTKKTGRKILLWNSPWVLLLVLVFLGFEWVLRKRRGLP